MSGGQFDWGSRLPKVTGGAQRFAQNGWKSFAECKRHKQADCELNRSSRDEIGLSDPVVSACGGPSLNG